MRAVDLIEKKRLGEALSDTEIHWLINSYVQGDVPDYQMSAFAMAVCLVGMTDAETTALTMAMAESGDMIDLSAIPGIKVDKHSTGGVGDTTTIVLGPWLAAIGVQVAKMSGRGLGHTGGTIDKLEAIPGFQTAINTDDFLKQVASIGIAVAGQTANLAPADKSLYALRDVTGTVPAVPLIASSIMSKKLASGADAIVLDVKVGDGAFMKTIEDARVLAQTMVRIGELSGRKTVAVLSKMEEPLGFAIGNALEIQEAIDTLRGHGPADLTELCLVLGSEMACLAGIAPNIATARSMMQAAVADGRAIAKFREFVAEQGGNPDVADDATLLPQAPVVVTLPATKTGKVSHIHAEETGLIAMRLGAGRSQKTDSIDMAVGIVLAVKVGDTVNAGDALAYVHARGDGPASEALEALQKVIVIADDMSFVESANDSTTIVLERITADLPTLTDSLVGHALTAYRHAYVPYSHFGVGAALQLANGQIITGCNVENASYGLTNCAERTAIFKAVSEYGQEGVQIQRIAVIADSEGPVAPCGACRQVLAEFCPPETPVTLASLDGQTEETTVAALLPGAFGPFQMKSR